MSEKPEVESSYIMHKFDPAKRMVCFDTQVFDLNDVSYIFRYKDTPGEITDFERYTYCLINNREIGIEIDFEDFKKRYNELMSEYSWNGIKEL